MNVSKKNHYSYRKMWYAKHPDYNSLKGKEWRAKNPELSKLSSRDFRAQNPGYYKDYRKKNLPRIRKIERESKRRRRALKMTKTQ